MLRIFENNVINLLAIFCIFILSILIVVYIISLILKIIPVLKSTTKIILEYFYLILIPFPLFYLAYYILIYDKTNSATFIFGDPEIIEYLKQISIVFFSTGIFSATIKYINNLVIFKKHFEKIIMSDKFDEMLTKKLTLLTFSSEHLSKLNDLEENWKKLTLCKYEQKFPELMPKLKKNLENELFIENNLSCYYKNFRIQINIELISSKIVKITEITSFTVIPKSEDEIPIEFWVSTSQEDTENIYSKFIPEETRINGINIEQYIEKDKFTPEAYSENGFYHKHYQFDLQGKSEYHIERSIVMTQDLEIDRLYGFSSSKIIDDISVHIQFCEKLKVFFSSIGETRFNKDNQKLTGESYINREVLLPGEKFNIFIYKK